jgi:hypothetical protein
MIATRDEPAAVRAILDLPVWAVVGLTGDPSRPAVSQDRGAKLSWSGG